MKDGSWRSALPTAKSFVEHRACGPFFCSWSKRPSETSLPTSMSTPSVQRSLSAPLHLIPQTTPWCVPPPANCESSCTSTSKPKAVQSRESWRSPRAPIFPEFLDRPGDMVAEPTKPSAPSVPPSNKREVRILGALCVMFALAAAVGWLRNPPQEKPRNVAQNLALSIFPQRGTELELVLVDSALVVVNASRSDIVSLDQYIHREEQSPLPLPTAVPGGATPPTFPGGRLITSFRDAIFGAQFAELGVEEVGKSWSGIAG